MTKRCKDCEPGVKRPAPFPGPRCATHNRAAKAARKQATHELYVAKTYGLGPGQYELLYASQGGACAICQRAKGLTKKLAVDHDHKTGLVRGLLCGPCNKLLGHGRDDPAFFFRAGQYLMKPPAKEAIGDVKPL